MAHPHIHAKSSVRRFGGKVEDYIEIHDWFDGTKELEPTFRHRLCATTLTGSSNASACLGGSS